MNVSSDYTSSFVQIIQSEIPPSEEELKKVLKDHPKDIEIFMTRLKQDPSVISRSSRLKYLEKNFKRLEFKNEIETDSVLSKAAAVSQGVNSLVGLFGYSLLKENLVDDNKPLQLDRFLTSLKKDNQNFILNEENVNNLEICYNYGLLSLNEILQALKRSSPIEVKGLEALLRRAYSSHITKDYKILQVGLQLAKSQSLDYAIERLENLRTKQPSNPALMTDLKNLYMEKLKVLKDDKTIAEVKDKIKSVNNSLDSYLDKALDHLEKWSASGKFGAKEFSEYRPTRKVESKLPQTLNELEEFSLQIFTMNGFLAKKSNSGLFYTIRNKLNFFNNEQSEQLRVLNEADNLKFYAIINDILMTERVDVPPIGFISRLGNSNEINLTETSYQLLREITTIIRRVLEKLPDYNEETVWRGAVITAEQLQRFQIGSQVQVDRFMSTSTDDKRALYFLNSQDAIRTNKVIYNITSRKGCNISRYSDDDREKEVLFAPGTIFKVTNRIRKPISHYGEVVVIDMEEVENE